MKNIVVWAKCVSLCVFLFGCGRQSLEVCYFDASAKQFHCSNGDKEYSLDLKQGKHLDCMSADDLTYLARSCKKEEPNRRVSICKIKLVDTPQPDAVEGQEREPGSELDRFMCLGLKGEFPLSLVSTDNYYCVDGRKRAYRYDLCK